MYLGALLVVFAETILLQSPLLLAYAFGLWLVLHSFLVLFEEPQLRRRFGQPYLEYCASTPRWIPRRPKRSSPRA
jgi:protein-S-isoprenylcysteine O-methyltransferase Ste14